MKFYSLRTKVIAYCILALLVISLIGTYVIQERIGDIVMERLEKETKIIMLNTKVSMLHLFEHDDSEVVEEIVSSFTDHDLVDKFQMCGVDLETLYSSDLEDVGSISDNMCVIAVAEGKTDLAAHFSIVDNVYEVAMPIESEYVSGILYAHLNTEYIQGIIKTSRTQMIRIFNGAIGAVMLIGMSMVNYLVLKPIEKIKNSIELVIEDDYSTRIRIDSKDEFEDLSKAYNKMIDSIQEKNLRLKEGRITAEVAAEERLNFLAHMSHEIRSPLNSIIGFTSLLLEKKTFKEDIKELKIIMNSCNHLLQVVNEIIDISKYEQDTLIFESAPFKIRSLIYELDGMFEVMTSKHVEYNSEVDYSVPDYFIGDAYRIKEVLINLVSNALKFTTEGYVTVFVAYKDSQLSITVEDTGIGIPMDKQEAVFEAFAQSNESTTRIYGGSGLGLAISKRLALNMGGELLLTSDGKKGAKFIFTLSPENYLTDNLPVNEQNELMVERWLASDSLIRDIVLEYIPEMINQINIIQEHCKKGNWDGLKECLHRVKGTSSHFKILEVYHLCRDFETYLFDSAPPYDFKKGYMRRLIGVTQKIPDVFSGSIKAELDHSIEEEIDNEKMISILVADDVLENRLLVSKILESQNVSIDMASDGKETIKMLEANYYDCLLLDIQMPEVSGEDVLEWMKLQDHSVVGYVITLTANARVEEKEKYLALGSDDYMMKPIDKKILRGKIAELIKQ